MNILFFTFFIYCLFIQLLYCYFNLQSIQQQIGYNILQINMDKLSLKLLNGDLMPIVGLGTWKVPKESCAEVVYNAIKNGYKLIDCACDYGNEVQVGQGIKRAIDQGLITRKQLFVTSKLWNTFHRPQHVQNAFRKTLTDLGLEYLDLYLIHFPISLKYVDPNVRYPPQWIHDPNSPKPCMVEDYVPHIDTWRVMEDLVKKGLIRNIGISNFNISLIRDLWNSCTIKPAVLQVQLHPYLAQNKLIRYCKSKQIQVTAYSSFGAASYVELGAVKSQQSLTNHDLIKQTAQKYKKSPAQILLKWAVQQQLAIIPKTSKVERLKQNSDLFDWNLSQEDMKAIDSLDKNRRYNDPGVYCELGFNTFFPIYE